KAVARLVRSMPSKTATSESSSLSSSPSEGTARFTNAAAVAIPTATPSLNVKSDRTRRISNERSASEEASRVPKLSQSNREYWRYEMEREGAHRTRRERLFVKARKRGARGAATRQRVGQKRVPRRAGVKLEPQSSQLRS